MQQNNRRQILIHRMTELEKQGLDCRGCSGNCCTYEANSMMVTPLEALELMVHLKNENRLNAELRNSCQETVSKFRLDKSLGSGKRSYLRRTYTCPFFQGTELGCALSRSIKPYGCLAFNAHHASIKASDHCYSESDLLEKREEEFPWEEAVNKELKVKFNIFWDKNPLPLALLELWDKDFSDVDLKLNSSFQS